MAVAEKCELLIGQWKVVVGVRFSKDVVVFIRYSSVYKLGFHGDIQGTDGKICEIVAIGVGKNGSCPVDSSPCMRVELGGFIEPARDAIVISSNGQRVEFADTFNGFDRIRSVTDDVSAA